MTGMGGDEDEEMERGEGGGGERELVEGGAATDSKEEKHEAPVETVKETAGEPTAAKPQEEESDTQRKEVQNGKVLHAKKVVKAKVLLGKSTSSKSEVEEAPAQTDEVQVTTTVTVAPTEDTVTSSAGDQSQQNTADTPDLTAHVLEYLEWLGLQETAKLLLQEAQQKGVVVSKDLSAAPPPLSPLLLQGVTEGSSLTPADVTEMLLKKFDEGVGEEFFQVFDQLLARQPTHADVSTLTLQFHLHVYFATAPLRQGRKQDHPPAMASFRKFLDSCPPQLGSVTELLPFYALPYVPEPEDHAAFATVFQDPWMRSLRSRLGAWLNESLAPPPALLALARRANRSSSSVGVAMSTSGNAAEVRRSHRTLRRRLLRLQDDYHRLLGVAMELTRALEQSVAGAAVDLESTLAACTHRHPDLFTQALADVQVPPTSILLETMQRSRQLSVSSCCVTALDYDKVRRTLTEGTEQEVLLLLQALRQRVTRTTHGGSRQAVLAAFVRSDLLGLTAPTTKRTETGQTTADTVNAVGPEPAEAVGFGCWERLHTALKSDQPHPLGQSVARLLSTLASFRLGRSYLAKLPAVSSALLEVLLQELGDPATQDLCLAALQKLSVRGDVQERLVAGGCVEWVSRALREGAGSLSLSSEECCAALLLNLSLRSRARLAAAPVADSLLPTLAKLLADRKPALVSYITGSLYSLISEPLLRHEAIALRLDSAIGRLAQSEEDEDYRRQLQYLVVQMRRECNPTPPASPPPSPHHLQEEPEFLEEELELGDPVRARAGDLQGEDLLTARYSLSQTTADDFGDMEASGTRSAPAVYRRDVVTPSLSWRLPARPHSDAFHSRPPQSAALPVQYSRWTPSAGSSHWGYPADSHPRRPSHPQYGVANRTDAWSSTENLMQSQLQSTYNRNSHSATAEIAPPQAYSASYTRPYPRPSHLHPTTPPATSSVPYSPPITEEVEYIQPTTRGQSARTRPTTSTIRRATAPAPQQQNQRQVYQQHQGTEHYQDDEQERQYLLAQQQRQREEYEEEVERPYQQHGQSNRPQQQRIDDSYPHPTYEQQPEGYRYQQQQATYRRQASPDEQQCDRQREYDYQQEPVSQATEEQPAQQEYDEETEAHREYQRQQQLWQQQRQREEQQRFRYSPEQHQQEYFERQRTLEDADDCQDRNRRAYSPEDEERQQYERRYQQAAVDPQEDAQYTTDPHPGGYRQPQQCSPEPAAQRDLDMQPRGSEPAAEEVSVPSPDADVVVRPQSPDANSNYPTEERPEAPPSPSRDATVIARQSDRRVTASAVGPRLTRRQSASVDRAVVNQQDATAPDLREVVYSLQSRPGTQSTARVSLEADPLVRSLPPPKAKEYVAIFSSRPRVTRTPPDSASEGRTSPSAQSAAPPDTPRRVLPPISKTNKSYSRGRH